MSQRTGILTQVLGYRGWNVVEAFWESSTGRRIVAVPGYVAPADAVLVLRLARRWTPRCSHCVALCKVLHERGKARRWADLPWAGHRVELEYAPDRVKCKACRTHSTELVAWADPRQRQTKRLQQHLALDAFSMPLSHVATKYGLSWHTVRRAEASAIERWDKTREHPPLHLIGVDEKWLGRRHKRPEKYVTIVSNLETGEPQWIGYGRGEKTLSSWIATLHSDEKAAIKLFACDMHNPFLAAIRAAPCLSHVAIVHDPFHIMKRAGEAISELRRQVFFRGGADLRAVGRGTRWLVLRAWSKASEEDRAKLRNLFTLNAKLARAYQVVEELREALKAPDKPSMSNALSHILSRTAKRANAPMRKLHESLRRHWNEIVSLGEHHPPTGRTEALNNNWEGLVRRGRGYRDHHYLLMKLRFLTANPVRHSQGVKRFLALGLTPPLAPPQAA